MTDIIFESFINLFQSVVVTVFLIISLGCKDKYNKKCVSAAGILITFIYLTVSNHHDIVEYLLNNTSAQYHKTEHQ